MRVLVTGASGYVGSHIVADLAGAGHEVRGLVRSEDKARRILSRHGVPSVELVAGDMTDPAPVADAVDGCDAVIHTAAVVALDRRGGEAAAEVNRLGAEVVLSTACRASGVGTIVHVSSSAVFSLAAGSPIRESTPLTTTGRYGASKAAIERFVRGMQAAGAPVTLLYPVGIYGGMPDSLDQNHQALAYWVNDATLHTSTGINVVDVRDVAAAAVATVERRVTGARFLLAGAFLPWATMADFLDGILGAHVSRQRVPGAVLRTFGRLADRVPALNRLIEFELTSEAMTYATRMPAVDGTRATEVLGIRYRSAADTMGDALRWLAREGHLDRDWPGLV